MQQSDLEPVSFHLRGDDLEGSFVVRYADGRNAIVQVEGREATVTTNRHTTPRRYRLMPKRSELGDVAVEARSKRPRSAYALPPGQVIRRRHPALFPVLGAVFVLFVLLGLYLNHLAPGLNFFSNLLVSAFFTFGVGATLPQGKHRYRPHGGGGDRLLSELVDRDYDERAGIDIVEGVKEEYGRLLSDVVYRVEHAALFDPAAPTTAAFTELMVRWDNDRGRLRADERQQLAADVRVAFDTARRHAEQVGLAHLPEAKRGQAAVAAKALRLAADDTATGSERRVAREKANDILASLMLYYLPRVDEVAQLLGGRARPALPGRRTEQP